MTKPVTIPNTFATATTAIPLSQLDSDFSTVATALNDANTYSNYAADTGVANAYVVTLSGVSTTYSAGLRIQFKAGAANTGASTLNVNGGGTKNITFQDASTLSSGTIAANSIVDVMYDGTQFLLMNDPAGATGGDVVGPSSATDNAIVRFDGTTGKLVQNSVVTIADSTGDISGVGTLNATTLDATNIEVTNIKAKDGTAAASIADSTGVISVTANPVLSGGTGNGVAYLNASKVLTTGNALTFDGTNLGIGTSSPGAKLEVNGNIKLGGSSGNNALYSTSSGELQIQSNTGPIVFLRNNGSNETARFDSSGNLGLGITPSAWGSTYRIAFQVGSGASLAGAVGAPSYFSLMGNAFLNNSAQYNYIDTAVGANRFEASAGEFRWFTAGAGSNPISFSQAMTLDASGNLLVGGTSQTSGGEKFLVSGYAGVVSNAVAAGIYAGAAGNKDLNFYSDGNSQFFTAARIRVNGDSYTDTGYMSFWTTSNNGSNVLTTAERARINSSGNLQISSGGSVQVGGTAARATTAGTNRLDIFNGTAPVGTLANGISLYSSSGEAYVMDAAGNATLFSPHDRSTNEWIFRSKHTPSGKVLKIDVERLLRFVNDHFGLDAVQEFIEP